MMPTEAMTELIEITGQRMLLLDLEELAQRAAHENDEEAVVPLPGSAGERFLRQVTRGFARWIAREGRFPAEHEVAELASLWHREADPGNPFTGGVVAQAFVDLGLHYSFHATSATNATIEGFNVVLDSVAEQLIFTLLEDYGPKA